MKTANLIKFVNITGFVNAPGSKDRVIDDLDIDQVNDNLSWLKISAIAAMIWDHLSYGLLIHYTPLFSHAWVWMRMPGRISIPIFALLIAWNYVHNTRYPESYVLRLIIFAFICEPIYISYFGYPGNAFIPLALGATLLHYSAYGQSSKHMRKTKLVMTYVLTLMLGISFHAPDIIAEALMINLLGVYFVIGETWQLATAAALLPLLNGQCLQFYAMYMLVILSVAACFRPEVHLPELRPNKWFAYGFYPVHLLLLLASFGPA